MRDKYFAPPAGGAKYWLLGDKEPTLSPKSPFPEVASQPQEVSNL